MKSNRSSRNFFKSGNDFDCLFPRKLASIFLKMSSLSKSLYFSRIINALSSSSFALLLASTSCNSTHGALGITLICLMSSYDFSNCVLAKNRSRSRSDRCAFKLSLYILIIKIKWESVRVAITRKNSSMTILTKGETVCLRFQDYKGTTPLAFTAPSQQTPSES
jgi:hypothetical protein